MQYSCIVIGVSAGGLHALSFLLEKLPKGYEIPVLIVQHRAKDQAELLEELLARRCSVTIMQANEKEKVSSGIVYLAPPAYHLLVESDHTLSLSSDEHALSKPSIDILFESAAEVYKEKLVGIVLTGANNDGSKGITTINKYGGLTIAQQADDALYPYMPQAAINTGKVNFIWSLPEIQKFLLELHFKEKK